MPSARGPAMTSIHLSLMYGSHCRGEVWNIKTVKEA